MPPTAICNAKAKMQRGDNFRLPPPGWIKCVWPSPRNYATSLCFDQCMQWMREATWGKVWCLVVRVGPQLTWLWVTRGSGNLTRCLVSSHWGSRWRSEGRVGWRGGGGVEGHKQSNACCLYGKTHSFNLRLPLVFVKQNIPKSVANRETHTRKLYLVWTISIWGKNISLKHIICRSRSSAFRLIDF